MKTTLTVAVLAAVAMLVACGESESMPPGCERGEEYVISKNERFGCGVPMPPDCDDPAVVAELVDIVSKGLHCSSSRAAHNRRGCLEDEPGPEVTMKNIVQFQLEYRLGPDRNVRTCKALITAGEGLMKVTGPFSFEVFHRASLSEIQRLGFRGETRTSGLHVEFGRYNTPRGWYRDNTSDAQERIGDWPWAAPLPADAPW